MTAPVWLVGSHHNFYEGPMFGTLDEMPDVKEKGWKTLTPEYLRRRITCSNYSVKLLQEEWDSMYVSALRALALLDGFVSVVSFGVYNQGDKDRIQLTKRDWGQIYLASTNQCVASFSHDTRFSNEPFYGLLEWLEDPQFDNEGPTSEQLKHYANVDVWYEFFLRRIGENLDRDMQKAEKIKLEAEKMKLEAKLIIAVAKDVQLVLQNLTAA